MVGFGHATTTGRGDRPPESAPWSGLSAPPQWPGLATMTLDDLPAGGSTRPHLLDHHILLLVTAGQGWHIVDFTAHPCRPGTLIWARPGQAVQYGRQPGLDGILLGWRTDLIAVPRSLAPLAVAGLGEGYWQLAGEDEDAVINEVSQLVVDCERHLAGDLPGTLLRHHLVGLVLRIAALPAGRPRLPVGAGTGVGASAEEMFSRFCREVEHRHAVTRRVEDYAGLLGCSVRTLTRASLAATGRSAKQLIDDRSALQARRMLACTDLPVATIGARLGFPEPTNFGRFFHREVGCSPGAFRARVVPTGPGAAEPPESRPRVLAPRPRVPAPRRPAPTGGGCP